MGNIALLDCTLRDGAYIVDSQFGDNAIRGIISKLQDVGAEIIECGWLKNSPHKEGSSFFHVPDDVIPYLASKKDNVTYAVMIDWDRYDLANLPVCDGRSIDAVRVVFPHGKHREGMEVGRQIILWETKKQGASTCILLGRFVEAISIVLLQRLCLVFGARLDIYAVSEKQSDVVGGLLFIQ